MSEFDATSRTLLLNVLAPIIVLFVLWMLLKRPLKSLKQRLFAYVMNRMMLSINKKLGPDKEELFAPLGRLRSESSDKGDSPADINLLEVGAGGGANFKYYPEGINYMCVEPNRFCESYLEENISLYPHIKLKQYIICSAEEMTVVADGVCDAVVCTMVLCSVQGMDKLLAEAKRILRPGGMFFFLEHVAAAPSSFTYKLQCFLNPAWKICGEGCNLNREIWRNIEQAGFGEVEYRKFSTASMLLPLRHILIGTATK